MRLQDQDFTYWFLSEAFGWSVVLQLTWTFDSAPDVADLQRMNTSICDGPLNRRVHRSAIPWARPRWSHSPDRPELVVDAHAIERSDIQTWAADELATVDLDAEHGRAWQLRTVTIDGGGAVLSLTCLHLVADGKAMTTAAVRAAQFSSVDPVSGQQRSRATVILDDISDSVGRVGAAALGIGRAAVAAVGPKNITRSTADSTPPPPRPAGRTSTAYRAPTATGAWAVVSVDAAEWAAVAKAHGGTANSLYVAVVAGALFASGYADDGGAVKVGIPVSLRGDDDDRGNATGGVSIHLGEKPFPGTDLGNIRRLCKDAFTALSAGTRPAMIHLQPLLTLLPVSVVTSIIMSGESGMPDAMVSNLGAFPADLLRIGSDHAESVSFRGAAQGVDPNLPHRFGEGLQSWLLEVDGTLTFAVLAFDEHHVADAERLRELLAAELDGWNIRHRIR